MSTKCTEIPSAQEISVAEAYKMSPSWFEGLHVPALTLLSFIIS
jgi:hypothetical protein